ncbi:MAG: TonB family protein [bacterium]
MSPNRTCTRPLLFFLGITCGWGLLLSGCVPPPEPGPPLDAVPIVHEPYLEQPVPDGDWRPHLLQRCQGESEPTPGVIQRALDECWDLYRSGEGADAITALELCLEDHAPTGVLLLTLGQLYLMAGQGEPELLPSEGPAADVGNWSRNKERLLARAGKILGQAVAKRPDDAAIEYLLADVARAAGDSLASQRSLAAGHQKCTVPRSFEIVRSYQDLYPHPARLREGVTPDYPAAAVTEKVTGEVVLDLLIDPAGQVAQVVPVSSPDSRLTLAAAAGLRRARFVPARIGKYPVWSWLRIPTNFSLG